MTGAELQPYKKTVSREGAGRNERFSRALDPDNLKLDDRTLEDFMTYVQQYTGNVLFYDTEETGRPSATWDSFYRNEPSFLMARIATKDPAEIKDVYDQLLKSFEKNRNAASFNELTTFVFSRFEKIDRWYASVKDHPLEQELALHIRSHLVAELQKLQAIVRYQQGKKQDYANGFSLSNKNNIWELDSDSSLSPTDKTFAGKNEEERLTNASFAVNAVFEAVFHRTRDIVDYCKEYFATAIYKQQDHPPHIALFITFIRLLEHQRKELNKIPARHLDYYFKDVLHIQPRPALPDQAFVLFDPVKGFDQVRIPKETLLTAGKDRTKKELVYKTAQEIVVNNVKVESLRSLLIEKSGRQVKRYATRSLKNKGLMLPAQSGAANKHKLFDERGQAANIGFAISSTQFYLAKGERFVTISFGVKDEPPRENYDTDIFALRLTSEKGWIDSRRPTDYITIHSLKKVSQYSLELSFSISIAQASGIVAFSPAVHEGNFTTKLPIMQFLLMFASANVARENAADRLQQLNELLALRIQSVSVRIEAGSQRTKLSFDGVRNLELENHESALDVTKPFYPFTTVPKVGSSFYIGCSDLYYKPVEKFSVNIEWMLPDNFSSYYEKYFPPYDSNKFRADLSMLKEKKWDQLDEISLIEPNEANGRFRSIRIDLNKTYTPKEKPTADKQVSRYDTTRKDGTLRLKLLFPDFGHSIYPQLITSTVLEKSSSKSSTVDFYKIVKKQLYDSVISIKLPDDVDKKEGSFKVVLYNVLEKIGDDSQARAMIIKGLSEKIKEINGTDKISSVQLQEAASNLDTAIAAGENKAVVNDDRFLERILGFLKKVTALDKSIHFDEDEQDVKDVASRLKDKMNTSASTILPSHWELGQLIITEINSAINQIVTRIADELLIKRKTAQPDGPTVLSICKKYIDEANEVINDMIARKIAILLAANDIPSKPYTPQISTISLNYISTKQLENRQDQFFHITPFGTMEIAPLAFKDRKKTIGRLLSTDQLFPLSTQLENELDAAEEGQLYIGLSNAIAAGSVTLFFHLEEAARHAGGSPPPPHFWYLKNGEWNRMADDRIISDSTFGLQTSGIIDISLPPDLGIDNSLFDAKDLCWLCLSVENSTGNFPFVVDVQTQAVAVHFSNHDNDPLHFEKPLQPLSIKGFIQEIPGIRKVIQPLPSTNGKIAEAPRQYYTRVSERIRHKQRAVNSWDYEHLLLEEFPFIYKVKCINNYCRDRFLPGHVTVVPIIDITSKKEKDAGFQLPLASYYELRRMETFLASKTSPFVQVHAVNPDIYYIQIRCKVQLKPGKNRGYYLNKLTEELIEFLTPWAAADQKKAMSFSSKIYLSSIISFIDERDYVEYVTDIEMNQFTEDANGKIVYTKAPNGTLTLFETDLPSQHAILAPAPVHFIEII